MLGRRMILAIALSMAAYMGNLHYYLGRIGFYDAPRLNRLQNSVASTQISIARVLELNESGLAELEQLKKMPLRRGLEHLKTQESLLSESGLAELTQLTDDYKRVIEEAEEVAPEIIEAQARLRISLLSARLTGPIVKILGLDEKIRADYKQRFMKEGLSLHLHPWLWKVY